MNSLFKKITKAQDLNANSNSGVVPFANTNKTISKIFIKDLELEMFIGVFESEKAQKQPVRVSIDLDVKPNNNWQSDNVENVVSYADIVEMAQNMAAQSETKHVHLVETFAEMIIAECLKNPLVMAVSVSIDKPQIIENTGAVGVQISRSK